MKAIRGAKLVLEDRTLAGHALLYEERIQAILPEEKIPPDVPAIDARGAYLIPGLIDLHIHGMLGFDVMDADGGLLTMARALPQYGVTGFLPTTVSMDGVSIESALLAVRGAQGESGGARILGAHMEGPYLCEKKKGAHEARYLRAPDRAFVEKFLDVIRVLTLAPETGGELIPWAAGNGIIVSLGHSAATYEQACAAFDEGASHVTHLFNGMSGIHHQEPGLAGAALLRDDVYAELIADTVHVRPELYPLIYRTKGSNRILLITDCMRAGGMPPGSYKLGNLDVETDGRSARLADGSLAGSVLTLNRAVRNFERYAHAPRHAAVAMTSAIPAQRLGLEGECGSLRVGLRADMAIADEDMNIRRTFIGGQEVYCADIL